jgi:hypothetical protein
MQIRRIILPFLLLTGTLVGFADAPRVRVLIVDGYSNHDWQLTTALIRGILEPTGLFEVTASTAPSTKDAPGWPAWHPKFSNYDVVIQTCNDLGGGPAWPREVQSDFEAFVRNGGGVYVWHAGNNAFADWPAYNEMIGLGWRKKDFGWALSVGADEKIVRIPAGEGENTGHGTRIDTVVHRLGDHPIHAGLPRAWMTPDIEVYHYARGPAQNLEVLSYGFDPVTKMNWPLEWTVSYGKGRVYTSTFGHVWKGDVQPERMRCAGLQTVMVRALQWLADRPVTWPVPPDFPTASQTSVRAPITLASVAGEATSERPDPKFYVFLCLGQSNMEGFPGIPDADKAYANPRFQVLAAVDFPELHRTKGHWYNAVPPLCRSNSGLSPADYFGRTLVAELPNDVRVGVVSVAVAGCKIELFDKNHFQTYAATARDWMKGIIAGYDGNPYQHLVEMGKLAQKSGVIRGILLHQGESNTNDPEWPAKVKSVYENLLQDLGLKAEDVPLLVGGLVPADQHGAAASMNEVIADLPKTIPTAHFVPSTGCASRPDHLHFTPEGYRELGKRYAETILPLLGHKS